MYKLYSEVPDENYPFVQQLIDLSYPMEKVLSAGEIDGIMDIYGKSLEISKRLLPKVRNSKLQSILSDRIKDFEGLIGKLRSGEKNVNNIQGFINTITDNIATTVNRVVGAVHDVFQGIVDGIFNLLNLNKG